MKTATRQYARKQVSWIKNKLAPKCLSEHDNDFGGIYLIDATSPESLTENVIQQIVSLAEDFLSGKPNHSPSILGENIKDLLETGKPEEEWGLYTCETCVNRFTGERKILSGRGEWEKHLKSNIHKNGLRRIENAKKRDEYLASQASKF